MGHGDHDHEPGRRAKPAVPSPAARGAASPAHERGHAGDANGHDHPHDHDHAHAHGHDHGHDHAHDRAGPRPAARGTRPHPVPASPLVAVDESGSTAPSRDQVGAKAASLAWLARAGLPVPPAVAVPADIAGRVARGETLATELLAGALRRWLDTGTSYAVRSSAEGEDGELHSFAGQLESRLDVPAADVLAAVADVASPGGERIETYAARLGVPVPQRIGVIVQAMVPRSAAGIAFSRNPLTGLDEVVVEAVDARGDELAGDGRSPDRWVWRWGEFSERPETPRVAEPVIAEVVRETRRVAGRWGGPVDVEWAHDGTVTWWLQVRPMTGLDGLRVYSNRIARDVLPGVILPLVWSVNVPVVNAAWLRVLEELVGPLDIRPEELARSFGYRAYFDMTTIGRVFEAVGMPFDSLELLLGLPKGPEAPRFRPGRSALRHVPRLAGVGRRTLARGRWAREELVALRAAVAPLAATDPADLDEAALLARVDAIAAVAERAAYANIVVPLAMAGYDRALARQLAAAGIDPAAVDPTAGRRDRGAWSPAMALDRLAVAVDALAPDARAELASGGADAAGRDPRLVDVNAELRRYLERFGHLSDSANDLSRPTWAERPGEVIRLALAHPVAARGATPTSPGLEEVLARVPRLRRPLVRLLWRRSGAFRVYRDAVGTAWARTYGLFRPTLLALGDRLVARRILAQPDDVGYLELRELRSIVAGVPLEAGDPATVVTARRAEVAAAADLVVPPIVYGDAFVPLRSGDDVGASLSGIPAARGSARGVARIVRGSEDFERVRSGDVLVAPFSDVAWTPLFARAAAVVTESGGILSHASVVAREYGIPCVVSVHGACSAIPDGATVVVDGMSGTVQVAEPAGERAQEPDPVPAAGG